MMKIILSVLLGFSAVAGADSAEIKTLGTEVTVTQSTSNTVALAANKYRKFLHIKNYSASIPIYLNFSGNVTATRSIKIAGGAVYEPTNVPINKLYIFSASGATSAAVFSGN